MSPSRDEALLKLAGRIEDELGWNKNDARVFVALVNIGNATSPQAIADTTGIDRARIYDSLRRLMAKGYVHKESKEWGGKYRPMSVDVVFSNEIKQFQGQLEAARHIKAELEEIENQAGGSDRLMWALQGEEKVKNTLMELIQKATVRIKYLMGPDSFKPRIDDSLFKLFLEKSGEIDTITLSLKVDEGNLKQINKLLEKDNIEIYHREEQLLPMALLVVDTNNFVSLSITSFDMIPEYNFGIHGSDMGEDQIRGMDYMFDSFLTSQVRVTKDNVDEIVKSLLI